MENYKEKHSHDLKNETYANLVEQTVIWIKQHESSTKLATYKDELDNDSYKIADKLLIRAIFSNYQLKRDLLNQKLAKIARKLYGTVLHVYALAKEDPLVLVGPMLYKEAADGAKEYEELNGQLKN